MENHLEDWLWPSHTFWIQNPGLMGEVPVLGGSGPLVLHLSSVSITVPFSGV